MDDGFIQIINNKPLLSIIVAWAITQALKVFINVRKEKRFDFRWFIGPGGMPSVHTAGVVALATAIGISEGIGSGLFAISVILALTVVFDAQVVRRNFGYQAQALNKIIEDIYSRREIKEERLKELLGHTPMEVIVGGLLGFIIAVMICWGSG